MCTCQWTKASEGLEHILPLALTYASLAAAALKYRNLTGTLLMPVNSAFSKLAQATGLNVLEPGALTTATLQGLLEYHTLFTTIDVINLIVR